MIMQAYSVEYSVYFCCNFTFTIYEAKTVTCNLSNNEAQLVLVWE